MTAPSLHPGVTLRAVCMGIVGCLTISAGEPISVLVMQSSPMAADYSTGAALFLFFVLTLAINPLTKILTGTRLSPRELATVYIMMVVGAAIPSWGLVMNLIPLMGGFIYYATPENDWVALIHPYLPRSLVLDDYDAIQKLFEGVSKGEAIPWGVWLRPLFGWSLFIATLYFTTLCVLVILRKQWVERERLAYPLMEVPQTLVADADRGLPTILRNKIFWLGAAIPLFIVCWNIAGHFFHFFPQIAWDYPIQTIHAFPSINIRLYFPVIGFMYFANLNVSFSI